MRRGHDEGVRALAERYLIEHARRFKRSWRPPTNETSACTYSPAWKDRRYDEIGRRE